MFTRDTRPRIDTLIGSGTLVAGDIEFEGGLHLNGRVAGDVRARHTAAARIPTLSVSETGIIEGAVEVPDVELRGTVRGDIRASSRLVLAATARVEGNVYYTVIEMALGAQIMGKLVRLSPEAAPSPPAPAGGSFPGSDEAAGKKRSLTWLQAPSRLITVWKR
ncbi:MAG: polymer-forming cytoskeletal protein [Gammaproteobacteria bacterium]|nr:polymer-forming cytoskeletal protein [Gammaproteobacteria bacterium]